ncbi:hypothetical protein HETIRDRAFT_447268 [Heterobasidion irregulare TC 32-1]|uniref:Integrase zinc-binding domain-containing protein n=1 Tax=Heterobasidion irregulare (strain TC 32-1) TaxID=747525 RepID=W4KNC1_HETIT|nr:uncharacterized protein HETIRDRAFT_447268 [Heterobasidion irregulare TC 32-1]ETW86556.1 hypothetical protein HETIRDRAFT_447268 [Heterobasidion irregulare TC 32-1]
MTKFIHEYVDRCTVCQSTKNLTHRTHPPIYPLETTNVPWRFISTDFITDPPESKGFDSINVVVDQETPPPMSSLWSPIQMSNEWTEELVLTSPMLDELTEEPVLTAQSPPSPSLLQILTTSRMMMPRTTPSSRKEKEPADHR